MSSFDRSGSRGTGRGAGDVSPGHPSDADPPGHSVRVRRVVRSSHPPAGFTVPDARDVSGARALPLARPAVIEPDEESSETRAKKVTPAERPRKRRQVQTAQVVERARRDTPAARPSSRQRMLAADRDTALLAHDTDRAASAAERASADAIARERRVRVVLIGTAIALLAALAIWALFVRS